jgi:hypothetical protein
LSLTSRTLALQLALGLSTVGGLSTLALAVQLFTDWGALGFGSDTGGMATSRLADSLALRAARHLAQVLGATDGAHRTLAMDGALSASDLLTLHLALRACAHRVAHSRASGVIALPFAHRMALFSGGNSQQQEESNKHSLHLR